MPVLAGKAKLSNQRYKIYCMKKLAFLLLLHVAWCQAQPGLPADFEHPVDTIYVISSPEGGGEQVFTKFNSLGELTIRVNYVKYNTVVSSPSDGSPFSRYVRVLGIEVGEIPNTGTSGPTIELKMVGCLVLVSKSSEGVESAPIMMDGLGGRARMFEQGDWYYCYVQFTKEGQRFTCNPDNSYNGDQEFWPAQNAVIIMGPKRDVTINAVIK